MSIKTAILNTINDTINAVIDQLTSRPTARSGRTSSTSGGLSFTTNFYAKARSAGLSEDDARDVYYHGYPSKTKQNMMLKDYNGYSVGIYYFLSPKTGQPVISSIWKNAR